MTSIVFDWDATKAASNVTKHGVIFDEASTVFLDPLSLSIVDANSVGEERWITMGEAASGHLVLVVHTWMEKDDGGVSVRIISARRPTRNEAREYREGT